MTAPISPFIASNTQVLVIQTSENSSLQSLPYHFSESYSRSKDTSVTITTQVIHLSPIQEQLRNDLLDRLTAQSDPSPSDLLHSFYLVTRQIDRMTIPLSSPCILPPIQFHFIS